MFQSGSIKPLPIHPSPEDNDSIGIWIERLAMANKTSFKILFSYITRIAERIGFFQALKKLTGFTIKSLKMHQNEFRTNYWKKSSRCPVRKCIYEIKSRSHLFYHLKTRHKLGTDWFLCPLCDYQFKTKEELFSHGRTIHGVIIIFE